MSTDSKSIRILTFNDRPLIRQGIASRLRLKRRVAMTSVFRGLRSAIQHELIGQNLLFVLLAANICGTAFAQPRERTITQFVHTSWGEKEGAPKFILGFAQTPDRFLWIAGTDGLTRFDGVNFEHYEPTSGPKLPSGSAFSLLALPNGDLWIGFFHGEISLLRAGRAVNYSLPEGFGDARVRSLAQDESGTIWAATGSGLARFEGDRWIGVGKDWNFPVGGVFTIFVDRQGTLWADTENAIAFLPKASRTFQSTSIQVGPLGQIAEARNGKLWMAEATRSVRPIPLGTKSLPPDETEVRVGAQGIFFDRDGDLWIATLGDGLRRVPAPEALQGKPDRSGASIEGYTAKNGLTNNLVLRVFQDREGNIWVGTISGLDRFRKSSFTPLVSQIRSQNAALIPADDGDIWILGLSFMGPALVHGSMISRLPSGASSHLAPFVGVYREPAGPIWWMTSKELLRSVKDRFTRFPLPRGLVDKDPLPPRPIALSEDRYGVLWIAKGQEGLFYRKGDTWSRFDTPPELKKLKPTTAYTDDNGRVWFGYDEGTIIYLDDGEIRTVATGQHSPVGDVSAIRGHNQQIWIGGTSGLAFFDGKRLLSVVPSDTGTFQILGGMEESADGGLWLRESRGVVHIGSEELHKFLDTPTYHVHYELFDSLDGLPGGFDVDVKQGEVQDSKGRLWFIANNGFASLDPMSIPRKDLPPPTAIRAVIADGRRFPSQDGSILPPLTGRLEIDFSGLNLSTPERVRYRYELDGADKGWQDAGTSRQAFYTNLAPGKHRFHLNARNEGGKWNAEDTVLEFSIIPAWFQTVWFRTACLGAFVLMLWGGYQLRLQQLRRQFHMMLEARVGERTRIARDLHDTLLQSFHGLLLSFQTVYDLLPTRSAEAKLSLGRAIDEAAEAITEGRDAVEGLRSSAVETNDIAKAIKGTGDELAMAETNPASAVFKVDVEGTPRNLHPILRDEVYRIAGEGLRNAFRHARARQIEVEIHYEDRQFRLRVRDDGKGIDPELLGGDGRAGHFGLHGMLERAKLAGGKLAVWSELDSGTEIELAIPASIAYAKSPRRSWWSKSYAVKGQIRRD